MKPQFHSVPRLSVRDATPLSGLWWLLAGLFSLVVSTASAQPPSLPERPRLGLVLSGGGARGLAHVGTLKMLDSLQIEVDYIAGTSMGGIIGAFYAMGYSGEEIEEQLLKIQWRDLFHDNPSRATLPFFRKRETGRYQLSLGFTGFKPTPPSGLIFGQNISRTLVRYTFPFEVMRDFDRLPIPFRCVAIDLITGQQVVLGRGSLARAMRASMAIPTVLSPVSWGDSLLVDGGTVNNLPVDVSKFRERQQLDSALAVMGQWFTVADFERRRLNIENADVIIRPDIAEFTMLDFSPERIREIIRRGETAAREFLPELLALQSAHGLYPEPGETTRAPGDSLVPGPVIAQVRISGARYIGSDTIRRLLGLDAGDELLVDDLNRRVDEMYSLGYFEQIQYEVIPNSNRSEDPSGTTGIPVDLLVTVKELPLQQLRLGLRYDDVHQLVVAVSALETNLPLPGLYLENELLCGGQLRFSGKAFLQSRTLDFPLYPLLNVDYRNIATPLYSATGAELAEYQDRATTVSAGLGLVLFKSFNAEVLYQHEYLDTELGPGPADVAALIESRDRLRQIRATLTIDTLDDVLLPKHGIRVQGEFETSDRRLETARTYELASVAADWYLTLHPRHTIRLYGFRGATAGGAPAYKSFNQGRHETFVGAMYNQLFASRLSLIRVDYRFRQTEKLYLELMGNLLSDYEFQQPDGLHTAPGSWGVGIGAKLLTPVGPLEIIGARGHLEYHEKPRQQYVLKFRFGYEF